MDRFVRVFGRAKDVVIGMVHVRALPGMPTDILAACQALHSVHGSSCSGNSVYRHKRVRRSICM